MVELRSVGAVWRGTNICHSFDGEALQQLRKLLQGVREVANGVQDMLRGHDVFLPPLSMRRKRNISLNLETCIRSKNAALLPSCRPRVSTLVA
jgi:hypothetical protein